MFLINIKERCRYIGICLGVLLAFVLRNTLKTFVYSFIHGSLCHSLHSKVSEQPAGTQLSVPKGPGGLNSGGQACQQAHLLDEPSVHPLKYTLVLLLRDTRASTSQSRGGGTIQPCARITGMHRYTKLVIFLVIK